MIPIMLIVEPMVTSMSRPRVDLVPIPPVDCRTIMLSKLSTILLGSSVTYALQVPFGYDPLDVTSASLNGLLANTSSTNYIFNGLASLLDQLPNSIKRNGHVIVPAVIKAHTPLYHARKTSLGPPPSPEWLAFEPEMSFAIMAIDPGHSTDLSLYTYVSNRDLRVLYFDGSSAAINPNGAMDTQEVLLNRRGEVLGPGGWLDDYSRLARLCDWARGKEVEGFLRMNTGFELMWCNFSTGLNLVSHLNVTKPEAISRAWSDRRRPSDRPEHPMAHLKKPSDKQRMNLSIGLSDELPALTEDLGGSANAHHRWIDDSTTSTSDKAIAWEWIRVGHRRFNNPQPFVRLITSGLLTFYDPKFESLVDFRKNLPRELHRVWNISTHDAVLAADQVEHVLQRDDIWTQDEIEWDRISRRIIENWGDRLAHLNKTLHDTEKNVTAATQTARLVTYALVNPYLDTTPVENDSWIQPTIDRCTGSYTTFARNELLTDESILLKNSIEAVMHVLCHYATTIFSETIIPKNSDDTFVTRWARETREIMDWLDWSMWLRCAEDCGWDSICLVPMWPLLDYHPFSGTPIARPTPKCHLFDGWLLKDWHWGP